MLEKLEVIVNQIVMSTQWTAVDAFDAKLFLCLCLCFVFVFLPNSLIPLVNLEVPRGSDKTFLKKIGKKRKVGIFPFVGFHKYAPPLLARFSVGKPDGNFITHTDQTNCDVSWLWKVVCVVSSQSCKREFWLKKSNNHLAQLEESSVLAILVALLSVRLLGSLCQVATVF